jgi:hypothetical protein
MQIEAVFGTIFEADSRVLLAVSGPYITIHTIGCWHGFRGIGRAIQQYEFGTDYEVDFWDCFSVQ